MSHATAAASHPAEKFAIRRAAAQDAAAITSIWMEGVRGAHGLEPPPEEQVQAFFDERIAQQTEVFAIWVAIVEARVVGWQGLQPCRPNPISKMAESSTYVASDSKARGVGRALIAHAQRHASSVGLQHILGFILVSNLAVIRIVESSGWSRVGALPRAREEDPEYLYYAYAVPPVPAR